MKQQSNSNGVKNNNWGTPQYLLDYIKKRFFDGNNYYDPCPYNPEYQIDGLKTEWGQYTFVNPPYTPGDKEKFVKKMLGRIGKMKNNSFINTSFNGNTNIF